MTDYSVVIRDQVSVGVKRLIHQWQDKPKVVGLLTAFLNSTQKIEDTFEQLLKERGIDTAIGAQLDIIGLIVGEPRFDKDDDEYRAAIKLRIGINTSDGTEPVVSSLLKQITGATTATFTDVYPAGVKYVLEGSSVFVDPSIVGELRNILAATITAELQVVKFITPPFVFENDPTGEGFSDTSTNSVFDLVTDLGFPIELSTGNKLGIHNPDVELDPENYEGGYLADFETISI